MPLTKPRRVIYFTAVMYEPTKLADTAAVIEELWGKEVLRSEVFDFDHTEYYSPEMGAGLKKYFAAFGLPTEPDKLPEYKLSAVACENRLAENGRRIINIDPAYLAAEKIVVASTKNFTHRIYLGSGIYGDLQLMRTKSGLSGLPWTYADYSRKESLAFFAELYRMFKAELDS